jgi:hypothetical protein
MNHVPERVRAPEHAVIRDRVTQLDVAAAELLADRERRDQ